MNYGRSVVSREVETLGLVLGPENEQGWASCLCPLHEDSKPSFTIKLTEGAWRCRAGCGGSGDLAILIERITAEPVADVRRRLRFHATADPNAILNAFAEPEVLDDLDAPDLEPEPLIYDQHRIPRYWMQRGYTMETGKRWKIGFDPDMPALVIPVFWQGELTGLIRRRIGEGDPKYRYTWGMEKSEILFGWDMVPATSRKLVIVEGALDCIWLHQCGVPAVAILGSSMSQTQAQMIRRRFFSVILAFDADKAGYEATDQARKLLSGVEIAILRLPPGANDVQDCAPAVLKSVLANARQGWYGSVALNLGTRSHFYAQTAGVRTANTPEPGERETDDPESEGDRAGPTAGVDA